jgi:hypothetical protein
MYSFGFSIQGKTKYHSTNTPPWVIHIWPCADMATALPLGDPHLLQVKTQVYAGAGQQGKRVSKD